MKASLAPLFVLAVACGPELEMGPRKTVTTDDLRQFYQVTVYVTGSSGQTTFNAAGQFSVGTNAGGVALDAGDTVTVNGTALQALGGPGNYQITGATATSPTFTFVWTHAGVTRTNVVTVSGMAPSPIPTTASKSAGLTISVPDAPSDLRIVSRLNAGTAVKAPFIDLPGDFSALANGPGVVTVLESKNGPLQEATAGGGGTYGAIQYGYNVTITD